MYAALADKMQNPRRSIMALVQTPPDLKMMNAARIARAPDSSFVRPCQAARRMRQGRDAMTLIPTSSTLQVDGGESTSTRMACPCAKRTRTRLLSRT